MKKKGLIISTVVMVIILIASLTTATYAWFSANATASISDMDIKTMASNGITISTYNFDNATTPVAHWYNGNVTLGTVGIGTPGTWTGSTEGQGSTLQFDTSNAANPMALWGASGNGFDMLTAGEKDNSVAGSEAKTVYKATENYDYFAATIALQNTAETEAAQDVKAAINFTQVGPMATAARIGIFAFNGTGHPTAADLNDATKWDEKLVLAPFSKATQSGSTWFNNGTTPNTYLALQDGKTVDYATGLAVNDENTKSVAFTNMILDETQFVADDTAAHSNTTANAVTLGTMQNTGEFVYLRLVIWFEGTDAQCVPGNTGTGIKINIAFTKGAQVTES